MAFTFTNLKSCASNMAATETAQSVKKAACTALYIGAFLGTAMVTIAASKGLSRVVFGADN